MTDQWEPLDVQRLAKQAADSIDALYVDAHGLDGSWPSQTRDDVEAIIKQLLLDERAYFVKALANPVVVRINIMRGGIACPDDLVWLHDTSGPVAEKVRKAVEEQIENDAKLAETMSGENEVEVKLAQDIARIIRWQTQKPAKKRKK